MNSGKVFGIGLSRTGTRSLAAALNLIGVRTKWYPHDPQTSMELAAGNYRLSVLEEYDGVTDTPVVPYYPQLDELYPHSKFILTVREKQDWLESCRKHWEAQNLGTDALDSAPSWKKFTIFIRCCVYGCVGFNAERFSYVYDTHLDNVTRYFENRTFDYLVMDICAGDGWEKLCPFLAKPIPDCPFPRVTTFESTLLS